MRARTAVPADVVVSGIGETEFLRGTSRTLQELAVEASTLACADAGILGREIDGLILPISGLGLSPTDIAVPLGIEKLEFHATLSLGGAGPAAALVLGAQAIAAELATTVLVPCAIRGYSDIRLRASDNSAEKFSWPAHDIRVHQDFPAGLMVPMQWYALQANRWLCDTGSDVTAFRSIALATRQHAARNPNAYFAARELTEAMYDAADELVTPFRLFDVCLESDGAAAVVLQRKAQAVASTDRRINALVVGGGEARPSAPDNIPGRRPIYEIGLSQIGPRVLRDLGLTAGDLDFAEIYDCFTYVVLRQLEALGICEVGESADFVADGGTAPDGRLPVNTHGGLLSAAHIAGMNHVTEAVKQLRNDAGSTQVLDAQLGLVTGYGDFGDGSIAVLRRDDV